MIDKKYTVYKHTSPSGKCYIGITSTKPQYRWWYGKGYSNNPYFYRAIQKYGWDNFQHDILFTGLTKEEAEQKEIELIAFYNSTNIKYGYNIKAGGNHKGTYAQRTKDLISKKAKERYMDKNNNPMFGRTHTVEARENISKNHKIPVCQYSLNNEYIKTYESAKDASIETGINAGNIGSCCKFRNKTAGGYIWRYAHDELREAI